MDTTKSNCGGGYDMEEDCCSVCLLPMDVFSIGECNHIICQVCSIRMRVLCRQNQCPICRQDLPMVVLTRKKVNFKEIKNNIYPMDRKYKICFEDKIIREHYNNLLEHSCDECLSIKFRTIGHLERHVRRVHEKYYCELCIARLDVFTSERKTYTRKELVTHRRKGDADDTSHKGHPSCDFCHKRFFDKEELFKHLRKDHYFCHFCDNDGANLYFSDYQELRVHFGRDHYLCEEGDCGEEKFTSVFRTEIDFKAHRIDCHCGELGRASRQDRIIDIDFAGPRRRFGNRDRRDGVREPEVRYGSIQSDNIPNMDRDFPSLQGGSTEERRTSGSMTMSSGRNVGVSGALESSGASWSNRTGAAPHMEENFPGLPGSSFSNPTSHLVSLPMRRAKPQNKGPSKQKSSGNGSDFPSLGGPEKENLAHFVKSENKLVKPLAPGSRWKFGELI